MLTAEELVNQRDKSDPSNVSFGIKYFEPDGSLEQSRQIDSALSNIEDIISSERVKMIGSLSVGAWHPDLKLVHITHQTGCHWSTFGHNINEKLYVHPEEALYLLESGSLEITFNGLPLSIQRAYSILLGSTSSTSQEKYRVYAYLCGLGYTVVRHSTENLVKKYEKQLKIHKLGIKLKKFGNSNLKREKTEECNSINNLAKKAKVEEVLDFPLISTENKDTKEILKNLQIFKSGKTASNSALSFDFDLYLNSSTEKYKKSCLQLPNYRIKVYSGKDLMPDINEIGLLVRKFEDEVPVIHAIVLPDHIAFYEINHIVIPDAFHFE